MSNAIHENDLGFVINLINDLILADTDSAISVGSGQFSATGRTRIPGELLNCRDYSVVKFG